MEYDLTTHPEAKRNYLVLHGFYENSSIIKKNLSSVLPEKANILIPNGCFPLPKRRPDGWELFFSWYFFDEKTQTFYVPYKFPAEALEKLVKQLKFDELPLTIIGYSQGGYLSPFVGERLPNCDTVIGLGCSYKHDMLQKSSHYKIHGIHGSADDKVDPINAENCFNQLDKLGIKGEFTMLPNIGHELEANFLDKLSSYLK